MYHPSRGGVRGGRDQFNWDDVKADKYRENYLGHSVKAPVGRWQKGKDLMWYARDTKQTAAEAAASAREEIERVKQEEEDAMREALGLAPRRANKPRGNRLDKREQEELLKRSKAGDEAEKSYAQGERIEGLGFAPAPKTEMPDKKGLLQREAGPEEEGPLAQIVTEAHNRERQEHEAIADVGKDDSPQVSNEHGKTRRRKEEKRAAKEKRREEKRAAKKARRENWKQQTSVSSDEGQVDREVSQGKLRRQVVDSDEEAVHIFSDEDIRGRTFENQRTRRGHQSDTSGDVSPRGDRRQTNHSNGENSRRLASPQRDHSRQGSDESDDEVQERAAPFRVAHGQKGETSRRGFGKDFRSGYNVMSDEDNKGKHNKSYSVEDNRNRRGSGVTRDGETRDSKTRTSYRGDREGTYGGVHGGDRSPRRPHNSDSVEGRSRIHRESKFSGAYRDTTSPGRGRHSDSGDDTRRHDRTHEFIRRQDRPRESSRRDDREYERGNRRHHRRSPSPVRRKHRYDS